MRHALKQQWQLLLLAVSFFTRIPVTFKVEITADMLHKASQYFALVGLFIGLICSAVFMLASLLFDNNIAILLTMAANLLLTGAFHEDGWADVWDGFGGGWQVSDKLNIMKDSRLGTYGAAALFIILMLKFESLTLLASDTLAANISSPVLITVIAMAVAQTLSRVVATSLIFSMNYVSEDAQSKVKPLAQHLSISGLLVLISTGFIVLVVAMSISYLTVIGFSLTDLAYFSALLILLLFLLHQLLIFWFNRQLGGYTGDCLGAAQQLSEVVIYLYFTFFLAFAGSH